MIPVAMTQICEHAQYTTKARRRREIWLHSLKVRHMLTYLLVTYFLNYPYEGPAST